jgi:DNA-binding transcriptional ArsR family regulator
VPAVGDNPRQVRFGDPRLIKALGHPMRTRILGLLDERIASPSELSEELGAPVQNVSYHVRELVKLRLIKLVRTTQRRGTLEHHYTAVPHVCDEAWNHLAPIVRDRLTAAGLAEIFHEVNEAAAYGGFTADDAHLSRTQLVLDEQGRTALTKELETTIARVARIQEQAHKRLGHAHDAERSMTLVVLRFNDAPIPARGKATTRTRRPTTSRRRRRRSRAT